VDHGPPTDAHRLTVLRPHGVRVVPPALTIAGMIATPLMPRGGAARRVLSVVGGLFATTVQATARRWGVTRTSIAAATIVGATTVVEHLGTRTGMPFGRYHYGRRFGPTVTGVPVIVPLAWFAMAMPARETAHAALGLRSNPITRVAVGAAALTAWDLFLDPQMVAEGLWHWARPGRYRGIPVSNYAGWLLTASAVMAALELVVPPDRFADRALVGEYGMMAGMETLGFARFFGDRVVAAVGGAGMLPIAGLAAWRMTRRG
jgi:uncharacterized membrane protein